MIQVTSLVDNLTGGTLPVEHGLSLYLRVEAGPTLLFDMGQTSLFARNATALGLSLADVDAAILSHGHYDHGGGLVTFLQLNDHAPIYLRRQALEPHYSLRPTGRAYIGLSHHLQPSERFVFTDSLHPLGSALLFSDVPALVAPPSGNRLLFGPELQQPDTFVHEQNLLLPDGPNLLLFAGCAHRGIVNIMHRAIQVAGRVPTHVFAGMHLVKSGLTPEAERCYIHDLALTLQSWPQCQYYTMHCTGPEAFAQLQSHMGSQIHYLACGETVKV